MVFDLEKGMANPLTHVGLALMNNANPGQAIQQGLASGLQAKQGFDEKKADEALYKDIAAGLDPKQSMAKYIAMGGRPEKAFKIFSMTGANAQDNSTSQIRNHEYGEKLFKENPQAYARYMEKFRGADTLNLGGTQAVLGPGGTIAQQYPVTPKMTETPEYQGQVAGAEKTAALNAEAQGADDKKAKQAVNTLGLIEEAEKLLPLSTSGGAASLYKSGQQWLGNSTSATQADTSLDAIAAALTSNVPRMEGPQGVLDVQLYQQAAADVGNTKKPREDRQAALATIKRLNQKYAQGANGPGGAAPGQEAAPIAINPKTGQRITLRDGQWVPM